MIAIEVVIIEGGMFCVVWDELVFDPMIVLLWTVSAIEVLLLLVEEIVVDNGHVEALIIELEEFVNRIGACIAVV